MFDKSDADRLRAWYEFRISLETSENPIKDTINFYAKAPLVSIMMDPYDITSWLDPWELLNENLYCEFAIILGIGYTLSLTDRFLNEVKEIHICTNKEIAQTKYLLYIGDNVIGYRTNTAVKYSEIDNNWVIDRVYQLPTYQ
jgi:hypothetical protein